MRPSESWSGARLTLALAAVTAAAWALAGLLQLHNWAALRAGFIPADLAVDLPLTWLTPLSATLVHAHIFHLLFNLLILLFCGRPTETVLGPAGLALLYVVGAYAAAAGHYLVDPDDLTPMIGASGAISAVLGAYAILFGRNRVKVADPRLALWLHALWLMAAWIGLQMIVGLTFAGTGVRIAIAAHIGGFLAGVLLANPLLLFRYRNA